MPRPRIRPSDSKLQVWRATLVEEGDGEHLNPTMALFGTGRARARLLGCLLRLGGRLLREWRPGARTLVGGDPPGATFALTFCAVAIGLLLGRLAHSGATGPAVAAPDLRPRIRKRHLSRPPRGHGRPFEASKRGALGGG